MNEQDWKNFGQEAAEQKAKAQEAADRLGRPVEWALGVCRPTKPERAA